MHRRWHVTCGFICAVECEGNIIVDQIEVLLGLFDLLESKIGLIWMFRVRDRYLRGSLLRLLGDQSFSIWNLKNVIHPGDYAGRIEVCQLRFLSVRVILLVCPKQQRIVIALNHLRNRTYPR